MVAASWRNFSWRVHWPLALAFVPPVVLAFLVVANWVNVPLLDEWWTPAVLFKEYFVDGHLSWQSLIAQHNESRKLFPRLIFLGCARIFGWDTRVPMALSWICCVAILLNLIRLQARTLPLTARGRALLLFFFSAILFSTNQWENWLWGIQLIVFIPPLCLTSCLLIHQSSLSYGSKVILSAALSFIATFSYANGMLCWLLAFPFCLASSPGNKSAPHNFSLLALIKGWLLWIGVYLLLMAGSMVLYFTHYVSPGNSPSPKVALLHKRMALHYLTAWIGSPFARGTPIASVSQATFFGAIVLMLLGLVAFALWRQRRSLLAEEECSRLHPWIILLLYGLASGVITTVGRLPFGIDQALASRYLAFSCYVFVGLGGLLVSLQGPVLTAWLRGSNARSWVAGLVTGAIATCFFFDWLVGYRSFQTHRETEEDMLMTLRFLPLIPDNPLLSGVYSDTDRIRQVALPLFERKILRQEPVGSWLVEKLAHPDGKDAGYFTVRRAPDRLQVFGWAMLHDRKVVPDCVVLSSAEPNGEQRLVTAFVPHLERRDVAHITKSKALLNSGFDLTLEKIVPTATARFHAYAVDLNTRQVFSLNEIAP
jgi:hypothetical protein